MIRNIYRIYIYMIFTIMITDHYETHYIIVIILMKIPLLLWYNIKTDLVCDQKIK